MESIGRKRSEEMTTRREYLRSQRDKLIAMKKEAREKEFGKFETEKPAETTARPKTAKLARAAMRGQRLPSVDVGDKATDQLIQARRELINKLKQEVMGL